MRALRHAGRRHARSLSTLSIAAIALFVGTALWTQLARDDLDWWRATLSLYLHGPWGLGLRTAYCVLAAAIAMLSVAMYAHMPAQRRSSAPCLLFVLAAVGLCGVAIGDSWLPEHAPLAWPLVHGIAAQTAFLCVTVGMLLQSHYQRHDPSWRRAWPGTLALAWISFVLLWVHVLVRQTPRGAGQKLVIALVLLWLLWVAVGLRQRAGAVAADRP